MNSDSSVKRQFFCFIGIGVGAWIFRVIWSIFFVVAFDLGDNWCKESIVVETRQDTYKTECLVFKDQITEFKHRYNTTKAWQANFNGILVSLVLGGISGVILMKIMPDTMPNWYKKGYETIPGAIWPALIATLVIPTIIINIFPPPIKWLPSGFLDFHQFRQDKVLEEYGYK